MCGSQRRLIPLSLSFTFSSLESDGIEFCRHMTATLTITGQIDPDFLLLTVKDIMHRHCQPALYQISGSFRKQQIAFGLQYHH
ncbi:hypothetical protein SUGI_1142880 [Cryptomeria japonica]|nr:hypothetical protein SUGI_1142880 [Cryptomeria japonica]